MSNWVIPTILQCNRFVTDNVSQDSRYVRDYEFDLYLGGERDITIDDHRYPISKGCMVFRKPGQLVSGSGSYNMYMLTLDFSRRSSIPPSQYVRGSHTPQQEPCDIAMLDTVPPVFVPTHQDDLITLYKAMCACSYPNVIDEGKQETLIAEFLCLLLADACRYHREAAQNPPGKPNYARQAREYINRHYAEDISVSRLAEHLSINQNYLIKLFKQDTATTPNQYLLNTRLFYAKLMLTQTNQSISAVAAECGFNTPSYFIKCFRRAYGVSPLTYRNG
ncbi:MAG: helix-turn-helix domain-containing protein [Ruminococcaceae bacterium]|nr:helix-turn-helix domain-containing protein [Oscillospiraceae bacterium]